MRLHTYTLHFTCRMENVEHKAITLICVDETFVYIFIMGTVSLYRYFIFTTIVFLLVCMC